MRTHLILACPSLHPLGYTVPMLTPLRAFEHDYPMVIRAIPMGDTIPEPQEGFVEATISSEPLLNHRPIPFISSRAHSRIAVRYSKRRTGRRIEMLSGVKKQERKDLRIRVIFHCSKRSRRSMKRMHSTIACIAF